jgi:hypothetical protein
VSYVCSVGQWRERRLLNLQYLAGLDLKNDLKEFSIVVQNRKVFQYKVESRNANESPTVVNGSFSSFRLREISSFLKSFGNYRTFCS